MRFQMDCVNFQWGTKLTQARSWDDATRAIMLAGKSLPLLPENERTPDNEVKGCESSVWMTIEWVDGQSQCRGFSDGKIVRGLIQLISEPIQNLSVAEFSRFNMDEYLIAVGLEKYLSPSRNNGVAALVTKLNQFQTHKGDS